MTKSTENTNELTLAIGEFVLPVMEELAGKLPGMDSAVLCTADGLNICSLEINDDIVGKMSSLSSTLFSIGNSVIETILSKEELSKGDNKEVIVTINNVQVMAVEVKCPQLGNLILLVAVRDTAIGVILMTLRYITAQLEEKLIAFDVAK